MSQSSRTFFSQFGFRKLPARYALLVTPLLLSFVMTCIVSLISTMVNVGMIAGFLDTWLHAWMISWIVAFPSLACALPLVRKVVNMMVQTP